MLSINPLRANNVRDISFYLHLASQMNKLYSNTSNNNHYNTQTQKVLAITRPVRFT
jgi:hypothetical protein